MIALVMIIFVDDVISMKLIIVSLMDDSRVLR